MLFTLSTLHIVYIKMSDPIKSLKEKIEKLINSKPSENKIKRIEIIIIIIIIIIRVLEELYIMRKDEIKNLEEIEIKIAMLNGKIILERIKNNMK